MKEFLLPVTLSLPKRRRQTVWSSTWWLLTCLIMLCSISVFGANTGMDLSSKDSTTIERTQHDLAVLKEHVSLLKTQEASVYNLFLGKYQYLERFEAVGPRWELIRQTKMRKLRELLGAESYTLLDNKGLLKHWFGEDQDQPITYE